MHPTEYFDQVASFRPGKPYKMEDFQAFKAKVDNLSDDEFNHICEVIKKHSQLATAEQKAAVERFTGFQQLDRGMEEDFKFE